MHVFSKMNVEFPRETRNDYKNAPRPDLVREGVFFSSWDFEMIFGADDGTDGTLRFQAGEWPVGRMHSVVRLRDDDDRLSGGGAAE
jgi:hypothetical protein